MELQGKTVALLVAPRGTEEPEFAKPKQALEQAGARVVVLSIEEGEAKTVNGDLDPGGTYKIDRLVKGASADEYQALIIPGGTVGADKLRADGDVVALVRSFADQGKLIAAICHAPWVLVEAGVAKGRTITSYPSLQTDLKNAGATWVDQEVSQDQGVITSRNPDDIPAFNQAIIKALS